MAGLSFNCSEFSLLPLGPQYGARIFLLCPEVTLHSKGTQSKIRTLMPPKTEVKAEMEVNKMRTIKEEQWSFI